MSDFKVRDNGTTVMFQAISSAAKAWWQDHQGYGNEILEKRYSHEVIDMLDDSGLSIEVEVLR